MQIGAVCKKGNIKYFPVFSPAVFWLYARYAFGLEEGSLMALATASKSVAFCELPDIFKNCECRNKSDITIEVHKVLNKVKDEIFSYSKEDEGKKFNFFDARFSEEENKVSMVMKVIQKISCMQVMYQVEKALLEYDINPQDCYLALSGGFALNCPTNTLITNYYGFKGQLIPPCTNDAGQSIGMGLLFFYNKLKNFNFKLDSCYKGQEDKKLKEFCNAYKNYIKNIKKSIDDFSEDIQKSPVIWFEGCAEMGPRALGHRSILADPRQNCSKELLNIYKSRQWWRPVAPIVIESEKEKWFKESFTSPYMLNNFDIVSAKKDIVPAVLHLDGTCRIQTINDIDNGLLYSAVNQFFQDTCVPIVCNTSLNAKGEPIINTLEQAINFALRKGIKVMYANGYRIELKNHDKYPNNDCELRFFNELFIPTKEDIINHNPYGLTKQEFYMVTGSPDMDNYDIRNLEDVKRIKKIFSKMRLINPVLVDIQDERTISGY